MPDHAGDEHTERFEHLRRQVLELCRTASQLQSDADPDRPDNVADVGPDVGPDDGPAPTLGEAPELAEGPSEQFLSILAELTEVTDAMLALEDRLPALRDIPARAWSVQMVRASALAMLLGGVLLALGIWRGLLAVFWFPVLLVAVAAAARTALLSVAPAAGRHRRQRWSAAVAGAAALFVAPVAAVFGWLPGLGCVLVLGGALAVLFEVRGVAS